MSDGYPPSFLLTLAMAMATATAWSAMSPFGPSLKPLSSQ
ncbi:putative membrane protein [Mycobacterium ulcerans str. Harvey]|uniref:Membrane protein n=1 Tax=Mycobacterium ulcerans str. Harvey TaxID=1299332 RepID=A0ABN0QT84_MYCUL|nr:putative membrane protein [Mycobacterium ulcerans str. Harvey]